MASSNKHVDATGGVVPRSSTKRAADDKVIDVDALPAVVATPSFSNKGKGPAKVSRFNDTIGVDNLETYTTPVPSSAGGPSGGFPSWEQKAVSQLQELEANDNEMVHPTRAVMTANVAPADAEPHTAEEAPSVEAVPAFVSVPAGAKAYVSSAPSIVDTVRGSGLAPRRSHRRAREVRASAPRRIRKSKFVRRAAVMTVVPVPRMVAGPPTPPPSGSVSDGGADHSDYVSGDDLEYDAVADADAGNVGEREVENAGASTNRGNTEHPLPPASVPSTYPLPPASVPSTSPAVAVHGSPDEEVSTGALPMVQEPVNAGAFAQQCAENGHNPRVMTAAFWMPGAQAVLAAAQVPGCPYSSPRCSPRCPGKCYSAFDGGAHLVAVAFFPCLTAAGGRR